MINEETAMREIGESMIEASAAMREATARINSDRALIKDLEAEVERLRRENGRLRLLADLKKDWHLESTKRELADCMTHERATTGVDRRHFMDKDPQIEEEQ